MLNRPRNTKYAKVRRGSLPKVEMFTNLLRFGSVGLVALESSFLDSNQIESCRRVISRYTKRKGKLWIRVFPDYPFTAKPIGVRMGKGKGKVDIWVARVCKGKVLFEFDGLPKAVVLKAFNAAAKKLPLHSRIIQEPKWL
jgi:large subunit ribosomal protein L16